MEWLRKDKWMGKSSIAERLDLPDNMDLVGYFMKADQCKIVRSLQ